MAEVLFRARLMRDDGATPWGFRLQGGADYKKPLTLLKVVEGSVAAKSGLHATDIVVRLAGKSADGMTHKGAQEAIMASGNALEIIVERADVTISSPPNTPQPQKASKKLAQEKHAESAAKKAAAEVNSEEVPATKPQSQPQPQSEPQSQPQPPPQPPPQQPPPQVPTQPPPQHSISIATMVAGPAAGLDSTDSNLYIPDSNNNQQLAEPVDIERETFVKDPAEFKVNPFHKPGAKRSDTGGVGGGGGAAHTLEDTSSEPSSSGSTESLDSSSTDTADFVSSNLHVQEEKLLATADDTWSHMRRSSRSPVPPGGEAWRREDTGAALDLEIPPESSTAGVYSEVSTTAVQLITTLEMGGGGGGGGGGGSAQLHTEPGVAADVGVVVEEEGDVEVGDTYGYTQQQEETALMGSDELYPWRSGRRASREELESAHYRGPVPEVQRSSLPDAGQSAGDHVGGDDQGCPAAAAVTPSLTFVGRRIAPPASTVGDTPTSQSPSPHISVTPSSPPTGLTVLPISQKQQQAPDQYTPPHAPYDLPQLTQEMSDFQQEALRLLSNNEYHSPRLEDIHFSTGGPEVVDIPMPAVKEMVEDLNRRLEAIAAQQPNIAQPPTAQEIGLSYIRQRRKELEQEQEQSADKEIFIDMPPAGGVGLESSYGSTYYRTTEAPATNTYQKLYDISSPIGSPTLQASGYEGQDRGPSPRSQRRVHFAEPPEQSVIEIEARSKRRHRKDRDQNERDVGAAAAAPHYSSQSLPEPLDLQGRYNMSGNLPSTSPLPSLSPVTSYASSTLPVMIERPASRRSPHHPLSPPPGYDPAQSFTSSSAPAAHTGGQFSVSITHKKADQSMPTRMAFTLPSGQPGQPTHFRYTMAGSSSPQQQQQHQQQQQQHPQSDAGLTYSLPPRYEDSVKMMGGTHGYTPRSFDDSHLPPGLGGAGHRPGDRHRLHRNSIGRAVSPQPYHQTSQLYVETAGGPLSPPRASPVYTQRRPGAHVSAIRGTSPSMDDATQSKSFRALEAHYTDGGSRAFDKSRVQVLGTPSQGCQEKVPDQQRSYVLQPAAVGRPFNQMQPGYGGPELRPFTPPPPQGALPGPPPPGVDLAGAAIGPGLFALFDSSFTEKFMQWQQSPRSHFESETYKLVHEMEGDRNPRGGPH